MPKNSMQYKPFNTRRFRSDLHYRLNLLAATLGRTQQDTFNWVVEKGLDVAEVEARQMVERGRQGVKI